MEAGPGPALDGSGGVSAQNGVTAGDVWMCLDMQMLQDELDSMLRDREEVDRRAPRGGPSGDFRDPPACPALPTGDGGGRPDTPPEVPTPNTDAGSADELDSAGWTNQEFSWMDSPLTLRPIGGDQPGQGGGGGALPPNSAPEQGQGNTARQVRLRVRRVWVCLCVYASESVRESLCM